MKIDDNGRIIHFAEKPKGSALKEMVKISFSIIIFTSFLILIENLYTTDTASFKSLSLVSTLCYFSIFILQQVDTSLLGLPEHEAIKQPYIASMGIYVFKIEVLVRLLKWEYPLCNDFGSEIIPSALKNYHVQVRLKIVFLLKLL